MSMFCREDEGNNLLFFFLVLICLFCNCSKFDDCGDNLLFFFLVLVCLFCNCGNIGFGDRKRCCR